MSGADGPRGAGAVGAAERAVVAGVGAARGVTADEVLELVRSALESAGTGRGDRAAPAAPAVLTALATVGAKAGEPGLVRAAQRLGVPLRAFSATALEGIPVPHPAAAVRAATGTPSVAEAAALAAAGDGARLVLPKTRSAPLDGRPARATVALATPARPDITDAHAEEAP